MTRDIGFVIVVVLVSCFVGLLAFSSKDVSIGFTGFGMIAFSAILYVYTKKKQSETRR